MLRPKKIPYQILGYFSALRSGRYYRELKNRHAGRRAWVIGNGPSLRVEDLDALSGEVTIASNRIDLIFPKTTWRPSYFTVADRLIWKKFHREFLKHHPRIHLPDYVKGKPFSLKAMYWPFLGDITESAESTECFSNDASAGFWGGYTVTFENIQLAAHLGCNPIYLLGCDHYYEDKQTARPDAPVVNKGINHFHPEYRKEGELVMPANLAFMNQAFSQARAWSERSGVNIYNATRGGHLEIFPRADFDTVISS